MATPHDKLAKVVFSQLEHARAELSSVLPPAIVKQMDWSTFVLVSGEFVDPSLAHLHTDLLYTVKLGSRTACIYVLLEHMSTVERLMPFRLLRYMTKIWTRFEQDHPGKALPLIIPVVLHHSGTGWTAPVRFAELFDLDEELRHATASFVPDVGFVLDDISKLDDQALRARAVTQLVRLTLLVLQRCRDADDPVAVLRPWVSTIVAVHTAPNGLEAMSAVASYIIEASEGRPEELGAFFRGLGPKAEEAYVTAAEKLTAQVRARALAEGRAEGEAKGRAEGQAAVLLKLLGLRFGPLSEQQQSMVRAATAEQLDHWAEKVLSAAKLQDVLES